MLSRCMSNLKVNLPWLALLLGVLSIGHANASIVIDGTRVVYPAEKSEVSVRMTNEGEEPKLVQVWIDDGDKQVRPEDIRVPFVIPTPIFRMDPKKGQVVRIQYNQSKVVANDRETVFWLNVLEIPAKPSAKDQEENYLQFRYRTRIKLFYRPKGIAGTAVEAPGKLVVKYKPGYVQLENPTAFNINISTLDVGDNGEGGKVESQMIAPFSDKLIELKGEKKPLQKPSIKYKAINDYGGAMLRETNAVSF